MQSPVSKIEVLIATLDVQSQEQLPEVAKQVISNGCDGLLINQTKNKRHFESPSKRLRILHFSESGISRSRNRALSHAEGDILLLTDDDVVLCDGFSNVIESGFRNNPEADLITFQCLNEQGMKRKEYSNKAFWHNARTLMRVSSVEIALRRESLLENPISFDERFGIGSQIPTGSETVFLTDALEKGMKILYIPEPIVRHPDASSGRALYRNPVLIKAKGGMFYRIFGWKAYGICIYFSLKKRRETGFSLLQNLQLMLTGIKEFKALEYGR